MLQKLCAKCWLPNIKSQHHLHLKREKNPFSNLSNNIVSAKVDLTGVGTIYFMVVCFSAEAISRISN